MKVYSNENNTATLKLLVAAKLAGKCLVTHKCTLEGKNASFALIF